MGKGVYLLEINRCGSCSSHFIADADMLDADVDHVGIEGDEFSGRDVSAASSDNYSDAGTFRIFKDCAKKDDNVLAEKKKHHSAVRTKRTERYNGESAKVFLLNREEVVHYVQNYIANAVDYQSWTANKNRRAKIHLKLMT